MARYMQALHSWQENNAWRLEPFLARDATLCTNPGVVALLPRFDHVATSFGHTSQVDAR